MSTRQIVRFAPFRKIEYSTSDQGWQDRFLELLPKIEKQFNYNFRGLDEESREDAIQEGIANCLVAYTRLHEQGRAKCATASSLARYATKQINSGRKVGSRLNGRDPLSRYAQLRNDIVVESLHRYSRENGEWLESVVEDRRTPIPDRVALRIDFPEWLGRHTERLQRITKDLAMGCTTGELAKKYDLSAGRISQIRQELYNSWLSFHQESPGVSPAAA